MERNAAEIFATRALGWLAAQDEILPVFMGASGASAEDMRHGAVDPAFLGAVLDFLMMDDAWVIACCDALGAAYTQPQAARAALPGGAEMHWT